MHLSFLKYMIVKKNFRIRGHEFFNFKRGLYRHYNRAFDFSLIYKEVKKTIF